MSYPALDEVLVFAFLPLLIGLASSIPNLQVGEPARLFSLPAINENAARDLVNSSQVNLADLTEGSKKTTKGVVLFFFSKEKGGQDLKELNKLSKKYQRKGIRFIGISVDQGDLGALSDWIESSKLSFPVLRDNHRVVAQRYSISQLPMTYVIDNVGDVLAIGAPTGAQIAPEIEAELVPLLR